MTPDRADVLSQLRSLLQKGAPWDAADVFRSAGPSFGDDAELLYWARSPTRVPVRCASRAR